MQDRLRVNQASWDERTLIHLPSRFYDVDGWLRDGRGPKAQEVDVIGDVSGLRLLHLQCHFGLETLSWARAGATVTGLDFSAVAVQAAQDLAHRAGLTSASRFVCADVYNAVEALDGQAFDIVYVSLGSLCWLPSIDRWAEQVAALVCPGGRFYIHDVHPLAWALADDGGALAESYFEEPEPYVDDSAWTYTDSGSPRQNRRSYEWNHSIGEVVSALLGKGLVLDRLVEHDWTVWAQFPWLVRNADGRWVSGPGRPRLPLSFSALASRTLEG